jgi:Spy/CpxP family protein refolding chaperone
MVALPPNKGKLCSIPNAQAKVLTMRIALTSLFLLVTATAVAQTPYAGLQTRPVKALSEQQIADLNAGRGMGLALAAELNGYPGPSHVLELADKLELSSDQRQKVQSLFDSMKAEAQPLGSKLIAQETDLDRLFASRAITTDSLKASTTAIAVTQGELRETHLKYHLSTAAILTPAQMQRYADLRGYGSSGTPEHRHRH